MLLVVRGQVYSTHDRAHVQGLPVPLLWDSVWPHALQAARAIEHRQLWQVGSSLASFCLELQGSVKPMPGVDDQCVARMLWEQAVVVASATLAHFSALQTVSEGCSKCGCEAQEHRAVDLVQQPCHPSMVVRLGWCCVQCCPMACDVYVG